MTHAPLPAEQENVLDAIAARIRRAGDHTLVAWAIVGLLGVGCAAWYGMPLAPWLSLPVAVGAGGLWGIADRELHERARRTGTAPADVLLPAPPLALRLLRVTSAALGIAALALFVLRVLAALLGRIIS